MHITTFLILSLAVWRISNLLVNEDGPYQMLAEFRHSAVKVTHLFECVFCLSVWLGLIVAVAWYFYPFWAVVVTLPFALSAGAILADRYING